MSDLSPECNQERTGKIAFDRIADQPVEDVRVPVAVRAERRGGVVHVQSPQPVETDRRVDLVETRIERGRVRSIFVLRLRGVATGGGYARAGGTALDSRDAAAGG